MKRTLLVFLLVNLVLSACAPASAPTSTLAPSVTPLSTATAMPTLITTSTPQPSSTPESTKIPTNTASPAPTALPTYDEKVVGFAGVAKIESKSEWKSIADSAINQYAKAFGIQPETVKLDIKGFEDKQYALALTQDGIPLLIWKKGENGEWKWMQNNWLLSASIVNFPIGVEIDPGHPNNREQGYRNFVINNANVINISGGLSHQWLSYGRAYVPEIVRQYKERNPNTPLTIHVNHLFYHHDTFPPELSDQSKPLAERQQLARSYMRERVREVLKIIVPIIEQYPNTKIMANLGNEVFWEYQGNVGWEGEYSDYPLYDLLGKDWLPEAYVAFEEVIKEYQIPRDKVTLLLNDWGIELPGKKSDYYFSQKKWVVAQIAKRLGISPKEVQLATGIQFGYDIKGRPENDYAVIYTRKILKLLETEDGRQELVNHLNSLEGGFFVTELVTDDPETMNKVLEVLERVNKDQIKGVIFWSALVRPNSGEIHYAGNTVVDKKTYAPLSSYYEVLKFLVSRLPGTN